MLELDDIQLMALVKKGDTGAFRQIIQHHQISLLNFFRRLGADIDRAEDCVQETLIKLFNYRYKYRPVNLADGKAGKFTTFLYTLARHTWVDELRRQKRSGISALLSDRDTTVKAEAIRKNNYADDRLDIQMALGKLSEKLRMTVVLSIYQGLNYEEIGRVLKIPTGTVKSRMFLAFQQLKEVLRDDK